MSRRIQEDIREGCAALPFIIFVVCIVSICGVGVGLLFVEVFFK